MEFVKFPNLREAGSKEVFSYLKDSVKCKDNLYLYPFTDNYGIAYCGEPTDEELFPAVVAGRLIKRKEPFIFLFSVVREGKEYLGGIYYDRKEIEGILVFLQERPVKSLLSYFLKKGNGSLPIYYMGDEKGYQLILKVLSELKAEKEVIRVKPKPMTDEERKALIREPNPFEFFKLFSLSLLRKIKREKKEKPSEEKEKGRDKSGAGKILKFGVLAVLVAAGVVAGKYGYKYYRNHQGIKVGAAKKEKKKVQITAYDRNRSAWKLVKKLLSDCTQGVVEYDGRKVSVYGDCDFPEGGTPLIFESGEPKAVVYAVRPKKFKGKAITKKELLKEVLSRKATGTEKEFYFEVKTPEGIEFLFDSSVNFKARIEKSQKGLTVEVSL